MLKILIITVLFSPFLVGGIVEDLEIVSYWDCKMEESLPITFNHLLGAGYFTTHSARMREPGEFGVGYADLNPYRHINARFQPFSHLELTGNWRFFRGVKDEKLSPHGFGDYADRGANVKLALAIPEDSCNELPGFAVGIDDFMGSRKFTTYYLVGTQVFHDYGVELSLGWGTGRYSHGPSEGIFGGVAWYPFFHCGSKWIERFSVCLEYDPTNYKHDPHPKARKVRSHFNGGIQYNFSDLISLSASFIKGNTFAFAGSCHANFGRGEGFIPKFRDPPPYTAPVDKSDRPDELFIQTLSTALFEQGFFLHGAWIDECGNLTLQVINQRYRYEEVVRCRLQNILSALTPANMECIKVILESYGMPCQEYSYRQDILSRWINHEIGPFEFDLLTPRLDARKPCSQLIYDTSPPIFCPYLHPVFESFLGGRKGKFKYDFGLRCGCEGILPYGIFYELQGSYTPFSTVKHVFDFDLYNPSQLPNVLTDFVNYRKVRTISFEKIYAQKNWNLGRGCFGSLSGGYFQVNYAGVAGEILYYPACSNFAIGVDAAVLRKRRFTGFGFQNKLRKLVNFHPTFVPYTTLSQIFLDFYYDIPEWQISAKASVGKFLVNDFGGRFELTRYFESGLRVGAWITVTNAHDKVHGESFYNRGIVLEMPLDLFFSCSKRKVWNYGMAAWLRDAGAFIPTGKSLFHIVNRERRR